MRQLFNNIYERLAAAYGPQYWWPAEQPFEVIVGTILTQSVAWRNAEKAIADLKAAGALSPQAIRTLTVSELAQIIHSCGYYNAKAIKLKVLVEWLGERYSDDLNILFLVGAKILRRQLLSLHGIGPETADSILLYAVGKPAFVIDAYTRRIIDCIGLTPADKSYDGYQRLFTDNLADDAAVFNEYHALLVKMAKDVCRKKPLCQRCCLNDICRFYKEIEPL
jgi:endonuclease-3 related protein